MDADTEKDAKMGQFVQFNSVRKTLAQLKNELVSFL